MNKALALLLLSPAWAADLNRPLEASLRGTDVCGRPIERLRELKGRIMLVPSTLKRAEQLEALFTLLEEYAAEKPDHFVGGCHNSMVAPPFDPGALREVVGETKAFAKRYAALAGRLKLPDDERARWSYHAALLHSPKSPAGKLELKRSLQLFSRWYETNSGAEKDKDYQAVLKLTRSRPAQELLLAVAEDELCGAGEELRIEQKLLTGKQAAWLKLLVSAAYRCCHSDDARVAEQPPLDTLKTLADSPPVQAWAGPEIIAALRALLEVPNTDQDAARRLQEELRKKLFDKFPVKRKSFEGGC